ncbi:bifunctional proline dehydrogenase/L-glutamate gamma-semialdehyde dehydrogenase PutA [Psychrobacter sp. AT9]|uniref:bifunctional proline dehydrogenase/L-glutamate gamma-semialdehyde dehydrogenase PutA n=1 Tax=Psychrobacter sp. AT9 TaxID=3242893 RepID=UPI0039A5C188
MNPVEQFTPKEPILFNPVDMLSPDYIDLSADELYARISPLYSVDEQRWLSDLLPLAKPSDEEREAASDQTRQLVEYVRNDGKAIKMVDSLLLEYSLDTQEGILLMSLAEALIRVPDNYTADALIRDKMSVADWKKHLKDDNGFMVNASTWGMMMTGRVVSIDNGTTASGFLDRMTKRMGEPMIRAAMQKAMRIMGHQFVLGETIEDANKNSQPYRNKGYTYSFDMLGEAAITHRDAEKYFNDYLHAIKATANVKVQEGMPKPSVSIKLSALHPRYEATQEAQVLGLLRQRCLLLIEAAREVDVDLSIDAEEADRLEISLKLFESLYRDSLTAGWDGLGIVVQGYSKRAIAIFAWLARLAKEVGDRIPLRLVKGAYWDTEIKLAQQKGLSGYPVWTRKEGTDTAYLACARFLLSEHLRGLIWPQFATHNAHTLASVMTMSAHRDFEFQRLHGMGDALYDHILQTYKIPVRIYAPVGAHKDLLPYLVRRLLENGANSSFVHQLLDKSYPIDKLTVHPYDKLVANDTLNNPEIPLPLEIYGDRRASFGPNIFVESQWLLFKAAIDSHLTKTWSASPIINGQAIHDSSVDGKDQKLDSHTVRAPWNHEVIAGDVQYANADLARQAIDAAVAGQSAWQAVPAAKRAAILRKTADLYEENYAELMALCQVEAGKTMQDSIDEIKEAVDFCRFYADEAERLDAKAHEFIDLSGKQSRQVYKARGTFVCISPWNFPLAIYTGQIVAALAAGNTVVAKPAEQTSLIAHFGAQLMYQAGVPVEALQFVTGAGEVGGALTAADNLSGVIFTGSTQTAQRINQSLNDHAQASGELPVFIAETGGQNAMIVDSTALPEQVVRDAVLSAFGSAGQRCSACRILCVQEEVADELIELLQGNMAELVVGNPLYAATDVGPVIDNDAKQGLEAHIERMVAEPTANILAQTPMSASSVVSQEQSTFVLPTAIEVKSIDVIGGEHFGPILHVLRYQARDLNKLIDAINATGFGLTLGIHSRIENIVEHIERRAFVGNTYVNRNQIGAVVNVQPFGGCGLSGTGPKAGGPHYVARLMQLSSESVATEQTSATKQNTATNTKTESLTQPEIA